MNNLKRIIASAGIFIATALVAQPEFEWAIKVGGGGDEHLASQVVDPSGNLYSVGHFTGTVDFDPSPAVFNLTATGAKDIFISKVSPSGALIWAVNIGWGNDDAANDIALDPNTGNIVVTGSFMGTVDFDPGPGTNNMSTYSSGSTGTFVLMLDPNAGYVWSQRANRYTEGSAVSISPSGSVYVGVNVLSPQIGQNISFDQEGSTPSWIQDFFIWKFSSTGVSQWLKDGDAAAEPLSTKGLLAFPNDELVVGLTFSGSANLSDFAGPNFTGTSGDDVLLFKLNTSGNHQWSRAITSASNVDCQVLYKRNDTDFYVGGKFMGSVNFNAPFPAFSHTSAGAYDGYCIAMNLDNQMVYSYSFGGTGMDGVSDIAGNADGAVYLSGYFSGTADMDGSANVSNLVAGSGSDGFVLKLNASGNYLWAAGFGPGDEDAVNCISLFDEAVYCGGDFGGTVDFDPGTEMFELTAFGSSKDYFSLKLGDACVPGPPVPSIANLPILTGECAVDETQAPTATNNCGDTFSGTADVTFPISTPGSTTITWTFDDGNGNTATQTQDVLIDDVTAPVPDAPGLDAVTAECVVTAFTAPTATDNCVGEVTGTHSADFPITASTTITWTYDDGNGNTATQEQEVIIDDVTAPVPDAPVLDAVAAECAVTALNAPTATDNCVGELTGTHDADFPITASTTITWTYDDGNGNTATQAQDVLIDDVTAPVPDAPVLDAVTAECAIAALTAPTATDNCVGEVAGTHNAEFPITASTTITWTYDDGNGNTAIQEQEVVITPIDNGITQFDAVTLGADATGYAYQWLDCNNGNQPIDGETDQTFTAPDNGSYAVEVSNGECAVTSDCINLLTVGLTNSADAHFIVFPNPTDEAVFFSSQNGIDRLWITNALGQTVLDQVHVPASTIRVELPDAPGVYLLHSEVEGVSRTTRVIKY